MLRELFVAAAGLIAGVAVLGSAQAQVPGAAAWEAGKHYYVIDPAQPTTTGDKVEVTEVFSYGCPACNFAYASIDKIRKELPPNAVMNYVPASFNPPEDWPMFQRAYLAAKALDISEKSHDAMFDAVWKSGELATMDKTTSRLKSPLPSIEDAAKFYAAYGVKAEDFVATANSFTINTRMKQADAYIKAAGVEQTPTIIVNGKYRLTVTSAGGDWTKAQELIMYLVRKESGGK
jgi:protein dithiol oxidoreductase (disulfide-forming)